MKGEVQYDEMETLANDIESVKSMPNENGDRSIYWDRDIKQPLPSKPSELIKKDTIQWYLVYDMEGDLAVMHHDALVVDDYLLAEMVAEDGFEISGPCKIEFLRSS
uniref:Uncharacterized protein n=1 Tax=Panagrolaimus davidi TaxID=227884 RepID=A0A914QT53_9BILA